MPHHVKVSPVRWLEHSAQLGCDVRRVIGYRASCDCGWRGHVKATLAAARYEGRGHAGVGGDQPSQPSRNPPPA